MAKRITTADRILDPAPKGAIAKAAESIIAKIESGERSPYFAISAYGTPLLFRYPKNCGEMRTFEGQAWNFTQRIQEQQAEFKDGKAVGMPEVWASVYKGENFTPDDLVAAYTMHYWSHEDTHITELQALQIVAGNPALAYRLFQKIDVEMGSGGLVFNFGAVMEKKKDLTESPKADAAPTLGNT